MNQQGKVIATLRPGALIEGALRGITRAEANARPELAKHPQRPAEDKSP